MSYLGNTIQATAADTTTQVPVRQTVLSSIVDVNGYATALAAGTGLRLALAVSNAYSSEPLVLTFARGFGSYASLDYVTSLATANSDITGSDLATSNTSYIYATYVASDSVTWASTLVLPEYSYAFDRTRGALLNFEGADASTTMLDDFGNTWSAVGNAQIDTAQFKFGSSSLLLDGNADAVRSTSFTVMGSDSWEISCWFRLNAVPTAGNNAHIFVVRNSGGFGIALVLQ